MDSLTKAPSELGKYAKLLQLAEAADNGQLCWYRDSLSDFPEEDQDFINAACPMVVSSVIKDAHGLASVLKVLGDLNLLEVGISDCNEVADAKKLAREVLARYLGKPTH